MADFNVDLAAPSASGAKVISPVQGQQMNFPDPFIGLAASLTDTFLKNRGEAEKKEKEAREQAIVDMFTREQTSLNDYIAQGGNMARASAISRANFSKYSASFPNLVDKFTKTQTSLFSSTELGRAKTEEEMYQDIRKAEINDAVKQGYPISADTPPRVLEANLEAFRTTRRAEAEFERLSKLRTFERAENAEERTRLDFVRKEESTKVLATIGDAHGKAAFENVNQIVADTRASGNIELGKQKLMQYFQGIESAIVAASSFNPSLGESYKKMFMDVKQFGMDMLDNRYTREQSENTLKELQTKIQLSALASPENKALYGATKILGGQLPASYLDANQATKDTIARLSLEFSPSAPIIVGKKSEEKPTYDLLRSQVSHIENGKTTDPDGAKTQLSTAVNNILHQVSNMSANGISSEQLGTTMDFISSPEYAKIVAYGKIDKKAAETAHKVFSLRYEKDVSQAIDVKLQNTFKERSKGRTIPFGDIVDFQWDGMGVSVSKADLKGKGFMLDMMEREEQAAFTSDMRSATKALNQVIKAGAHLEGHTDYQRYWEDNKHNILPSVFPDPARLKVGQVVNGYKYIGGNVKSPNSWMKEESKEK